MVGPQVFEANRGTRVVVRAANASVEPWTFTPGAAGGIRLRYTLTALTNAPLYRGFSGQLARTVHPGEHIDLVCGLPPLARGAYALHADLVDAQPIELLSTDFAQYGSEPMTAPVYVA